MYSWIFRHLPGPTWLKVIWAALLIAGVVYLLFEFVYPEFHGRFFDNTIG